MLYWTAAIMGASITLLLSAPTLRGPAQSPHAARRRLGAVELPLGDRRATDRAVAELEAMVRALDVPMPRR